MRPLPYSVIFVVFGVLSVCADDDPNWWKSATVYQIYPRSFMDTNDDGIGDLQGIKQKAQYIKDLGVTAVWLSPIYKSPQKDFGYDISDYRLVDPIFGDNQDLLDLMKELKSLGVRLILDFVPNHSSDEHDWFQKSVSGDTKYRDWYVWRDPSSYSGGDPMPPNNWVSLFSGSAWKYSEKRKQYYLHQFSEGQPDLNYSNYQVVKAMTDNLVYWMDQGVDGFRLDAVQTIFEDSRFLDEPVYPNGSQPHIYTQDQSQTYQLLANWSNVIDAHSEQQKRTRIMFLEVYSTPETTLKYYVGPNFAMPFNFVLLKALDQNKNAQDIAKVINEWIAMLPPNACSNWVVGNHDNSRITTRMGVEFVDAMNMILALMPGIMVTYNGEELGMEDTFIRWDQTVDPDGRLLGKDKYLEGTRDPERTPMQWDTSKNSGFTNTTKPWLPINPNYWRLNVLAQQAAENSHLKVYQLLTKAKQTPTLKFGRFKLTAANNSTMVIERTLVGDDSYIGLINFGSEVIIPDLSTLSTQDTSFTVYAAGINSGHRRGDTVLKSKSLELPPKAGVVLIAPHSSSSQSTAGTSRPPTLTSSLGTMFLLIIVFTLLYH